MIAGYLAGTNGLKLLTARRLTQPDRTFLLRRHASRLFVWLGVLALSAFVLLEVPLSPGGPDTATILNPRLPDLFEFYVLFVAAGFMAVCAYLIGTGFLAAMFLLLVRLLSNFTAGRPHSERVRTLLAAGRLVIVLGITLILMPSSATNLLSALFSEAWPLYEAIPLVYALVFSIPLIDGLLLMFYPRFATPVIRRLAEPVELPVLPMTDRR